MRNHYYTIKLFSCNSSKVPYIHVKHLKYHKFKPVNALTTNVKAQGTLTNQLFILPVVVMLVLQLF
jgi:hypothetical protein